MNWFHRSRSDLLSQEKRLVCLAREVLDVFEIERKEPKMAADVHSRVYIRGRGPLLM